ncbi:hypothetical protein IF1G_03042 [Cordyceps javanica]|uniref:Uncharacterized protein n=1 Tax=Cordyceps javanica TaxID=43265 RepID=A0A545VB54_9HYPO|nr:hypothetical protein IF1G_03042 [Cordyceps javanica]
MHVDPDVATPSPSLNCPSLALPVITVPQCLCNSVESGQSMLGCTQPVGPRASVAHQKQASVAGSPPTAKVYAPIVACTGYQPKLSVVFSHLGSYMQGKDKSGSHPDPLPLSCFAIARHFLVSQKLRPASNSAPQRHGTTPKPLVKSSSQRGMVRATCRVNDSTNKTHPRKPPRSQRRIIGAQATLAVCVAHGALVLAACSW